MENGQAVENQRAFSDEPVQRRLLRYLQSRRVHPAVILIGPSTSERWSLGKSIAKQLLCPTAEKAGLFCGHCSLCRRVEKEIHPDVLLHRDLEEDTIKIDSLRELCQQMALSPMEARGKVCLIDDAHRMNTAAANAFLKTLEEPSPDRFFWLLTSQPSTLPETLLSRCLKFQLKPEAVPKFYTDEEAETFLLLFKEAVSAKTSAALTSALTSKEKTFQFLVYLQTQLRNAVMGEKSTLFTDDKSGALRNTFAASLELERRLHSNANYSLMLDSFFRQNFV